MGIYQKHIDQPMSLVDNKNAKVYKITVVSVKLIFLNLYVNFRTFDI